MNRARTPRVLALGAPMLLAVGLSCTSQPVVLPSRDFNRPTDITFVCMGALGVTGAASGVDGGDAAAAPTGGDVLTGRPMRECHPRGERDPAPDVEHRTFAFLPNSASGDLSVIDADNWKLVNLDPANFGYNALPLGTLPTQIAASDDGCRVVTANHGSCDLSLVDPAALLAPTFAREYASVSTSAANSIVTTTVVPKTSAGVPLRMLPGEVAFLPRGTGPGQLPAQVCGGAWTWQAVVTFPSCDLVALLDLPSGEIKKAAYVRRTADGSSVVLVPLADGATPSCPATDCTTAGIASGAAPLDAGASEVGMTDGATDAAAGEASVSEVGAGATDAGASEGGSLASTTPSTTVPTTALGVGPLALTPENGRAYVGLANAPFVVAFDVAPGVLAPAAGGGAIPLEGAIGVNRLRLSIDPYLDKTTGAGSSGVSGTFIGNSTHPDRAYLYVIARDGTMHVVQVAHAPESECETNLDPLSIPDAATRATTLATGCIPVDPVHRRPLAIGPGIRPPTPPIDVAVADISPKPADTSETSVSGVHAWMITASGAVYLVNIDPLERVIAYVLPATTNPNEPPMAKTCVTPSSTDCVSESYVFGYAPPPNVLRDRNVLSYTVALDPSEGLPRLDVPSSEPSTGPRIESVWTVGSKANETALTTAPLQTEVFFPDLTSVAPQAWTITWQGALLPTPRFMGELQNGGSTLQDFGADFCRIGVQPTDLVTLGGCTANTQCGLGKVCVLGTEGAQAAGGLPITGLCLDPGVQESTCDQLLNTVRRYEVTSSHPTTLDIVPHKDELVRPGIAPCVPDSVLHADGGADARPDARESDGGGADAADAGAGANGNDLSLVGKSDCHDPSDPSTLPFMCVDGRCLIPCTEADSTRTCRPGRICVPFDLKPGATPEKPGKRDCVSYDCYCADGPDLAQNPEVNPTTCLGELFPYQANVGRSFLVSGSQSGIPVTQTTATVNGVPTCVADTTLDPRVADRISMDAPHCQNVADDQFDSSCDPNVASNCPNLLDLQNTAQAFATPNACLIAGGRNTSDQSGVPAEHIRALFRNREIQFMMTNLEQSPSTTYQIRFDVHGGFQPTVVTIPSTVEVTMPARIVLGPFDSNPQTGPVTDSAEIPYLFVVDQRRLGRSQGGGPTRGQLLRIHPRGFPITAPVAGSQPWFEDLTHSNNLFPIQ